MPAPKPYNGHKSKNAWNVSLWISNEEWMYNAAVKALRATKTPGAATRKFCNDCAPLLNMKTPDGFIYNFSSVKAALIGLEIEQGE